MPRTLVRRRLYKSPEVVDVTEITAIALFKTSQSSLLPIFFIKGARGCMFDIKAGSNPIIITSLDIHARIKRRGLSATAVTNLSVKVFAKEGSHVTFENRRELWTEICSTSVTPAGYFMVNNYIISSLPSL